MMDPDWKKLAPQGPVAALSEVYVERPREGGRRIAEWVAEGRSTVLIAGPAGIGKSTELQLVATGLQPERAVRVLLSLDQALNMRRLEVDDVMLALAGTLARSAIAGGVDLSPPLRRMLGVRGLLGADQFPGGPVDVSSRASDLALLVVREVQRLVPDRRITLLIDGMEKTPVALARPVFEALRALGPDVNLVVVVSWQVTFGPEAEEVIRAGEKLFVLHPVEVEGDEGSNGRAFFRQMLSRRLGWEPGFLTSCDERDEFRSVVDEAIQLSGGVPRTFLQLIADAGSYARVSRGAAWPWRAQLVSAVADQRDSLRRLLLPGDHKALREVEGTDGREMELDRKLRLLSHGILLEHGRAAGPVMLPHPLVRALL